MEDVEATIIVPMSDFNSKFLVKNLELELKCTIKQLRSRHNSETSLKNIVEKVKQKSLIKKS